MAAGRPVVVTPEVGLAPAVAASGAGLVVDGADLGPALRDLLDDPAGLDAMGERGAAEARHRFGWPAVAAAMESAYQKILARSGP
jgi:glycosyltransferase involved in cell wall biosynthesis